MSFKKFSYEIKDKIAMVGFGYNNEKDMTVLCKDTLQELDNLLNELPQAIKKKEVKGLIFFTHKERCFLAGVDVNIIHDLKTESEAMNGAEQGQNIYNKLEDLSIPTLACIHGVCLGGGLELSLCCDYIIASDDDQTMLGLPEVKLGLIPGFGGTYRLHQRVPLANALQIILTGRNVRNKEAKKIGLANEVCPKELLITVGKKFLKKKRKRPMRPLQNNFFVKKLIFQKARDNIMKKTKGLYQAPLKILTTMESGMIKGRESYMSHEAQAFGELCVSRQSKNLRHLFFMMEDVKKYPSKQKVSPLNRGAVLGAGTMGGGVAWLMANAGMRPILKDLGKEALEAGLAQSSKNFYQVYKRRKISFDQYERLQRSITCQTNYSGFERMDLIIEAIVENLDIKCKVFSELEKKVRPDCIITSNTSSLKITDMAGALQDSSRFAGLHFFNPVHRMPLVEIVTHDNISPATTQALYEWCIKAKKTPIVVGDGPGFLVNRILIPYLNEAAYLLEEGLPIKKLDDACVNFGMPMGPCRLLDEIGIDVANKVGNILHHALGERVRPCKLNEKITQAKLLGKKGYKGFYLYDKKGKEIGINEDIMNFLPSKKKKMEESEIQKRVIYPMINEASNILSQEIVKQAKDVDLALIFGIGFPPFRGGLLRFADEKGLSKITDHLKKLGEEVSDTRFEISDLLPNKASRKKKFYD
ncbi:MAG: 3-hydroxyacyl-CoA dehydrogenase NAD-binding domain-containing protein [Halobacteriovoraceae bacterium]|nr:3-hydroxyacyl-CoA dehydrogenase NAD-binding domain-containing protein [Halobacteriovoraceae bacterium]